MRPRGRPRPGAVRARGARAHQSEPHHLLEALRRPLEQWQVGGLQRGAGDLAHLDEDGVGQLGAELVKVAPAVTV